MAKYRIVTVPSGKARSEWRSTWEEAVADAIRLELADRDDDDPATIYWDPVAGIECVDDDGSVSIIDPRLSINDD